MITTLLILIAILISALIGSSSCFSLPIKDGSSRPLARRFYSFSLRVAGTVFNFAGATGSAIREKLREISARILQYSNLGISLKFGSGRFGTYQHSTPPPYRSFASLFRWFAEALHAVMPLGAGVHLANTASHSRFEEQDGKILGLANAFELLQDDWIQLSPLGDFPHTKGTQRIDKKSTDAMANSFNSVFAKLGRLFAGLPFYIGHPDVPGIANEFPDKKAYGWVNKLESRADGLYGQVKWSEPGKTLLANAHYKFFSPYWDAAEIGVEKGRKVFSPQTLLSVGLTNSPNIPVLPLANEEGNQNPQEIMKPSTLAALVALLSMANTSTPEQVEARIEELKTKGTSLTGLENQTSTAATALSNEQTAHGTTKTKLTETETKFANERKARTKLVIDSAIVEGRITPAQRTDWETKLANEATYETEVIELGKKTPVMKTGSRTMQLGNRKSEIGLIPEESLSQKVVRLANERMKKDNLSWGEAFSAVQAEQPALFEQMQKPETL